MIGSKVAQFEITAKIGEGGMGEVYKATDTRLHREVALKFLPEYLAQDETAQKRFIREARSAAGIDHPYICKIHDVGESEGKSFIVMEFVEGQTLKEEMAEGRVPLKQTLRIVSDVASALEKAHKTGIVHRDLKPDNIMLTAEGHVKVMDFGLAKRFQREEEEITETLTRAGTTLGTLTYMSPEQVRGQAVDTRSDIFSFGVLLYEMLTGVHPFRTGTQAETIHSILNEHPSPISRYTEDTSDVLQHTVEKMLAKDPDERYQLIHDVRTNLKKMSERLSVSGVMVATARGEPKTSGKRFLLALVLVAALAVTVALTVTFWPSSYRVEDAAPSPMQPPRAVTIDGRFKGPLELSPDAQFVVYSEFIEGDTSDGLADLFVQRLASGTTPHKVTQLAGSELNPVWSPKGDQFAFLWASEDRKETALYTVPAPFGGQEKRVAKLSGTAPEYTVEWFNRSLSWSPDGQWIAVPEKNPDEPWRIMLISPETGEKQPLTRPPEIITGDQYPSFSPDGKHLAFFRRAEDDRSVWVYSIDDDKERRVPSVVFSRGDFYYGLTWTIDGQEIVFVKTDEGQPSRLYRVPVSGEREPELVSGPGTPAFSPHIRGSRLAYIQQEGYWFGRDIWRVPGPESERSGISTPEAVIGGNQSIADQAQQVSHDGKRIAFSSNRTGHYEIYVAEVGSSERPKRLTWLEESSSSPAWSPVGERISFQSGVNNWIYKIGTNGGEPEKLAQGRWPCWSQDGEWVYYAAKRAIYKVPAGGGESTLIGENLGARVLESTDGSFLYYWRKDDSKDDYFGTVFRILAAGGKSVPIQAVKDEFKWDLQGDRLYWAEERNYTNSIHFLNLETGEKKRWFQVPIPFVKSLAVAPDEKWIYYSGRHQLSQDIYLVENFR